MLNPDVALNTNRQRWEDGRRAEPEMYDDPGIAKSCPEIPPVCNMDHGEDRHGQNTNLKIGQGEIRDEKVGRVAKFLSSNVAGN